MRMKATATGKRIFVCALLLLLVGCAHPISVQPDIRLLADSGAPRLPMAVALHVAPEDTALEVTTSGGGGDSVRYFPYRDLEGPLLYALSRVFDKVVVVTRAMAGEDLAREGFQLSVQPKLLSASGSSSAFTWPPTFFSFTATAAFVDPAGASVALIQESGSGKAEFAEFRKSPGLAGQRAATDLINRLVESIRKNAAINAVARPSPAVGVTR